MEYILRTLVSQNIINQQEILNNPLINIYLTKGLHSHETVLYKFNFHKRIVYINIIH